MSHVVLLGDSIFDNGRYVPGRPAVIEQLRARLPRGWRATLLAVDGSIARDVPGRQLGRLPDDASHLIVSAGGNDALENSRILGDTESPAAEAFAAFAEIQRRFQRDYQQMLTEVLAVGRPVVLCTVYDAVPGLEPAAVTALSAFNDVILREAARHRLPVLDLRLVCDQARDYSNLSPLSRPRSAARKSRKASARS